METAAQANKMPYAIVGIHRRNMSGIPIDPIIAGGRTAAAVPATVLYSLH
jgi:hypothetical protein